MKVKGMNTAYDVEVTKIYYDRKECIVITCGNMLTGMTSVVISKESWNKLRSLE